MDQIALIRERISIVDFIGETVKLKKAGRNFKGLCPFHSEKSPSFVVSPERNIWHCFGCQKGGDAFAFLMELEHIEFSEALSLLAKRTGVVLEPLSKKSAAQSSLRERLLDLHKAAYEYYHYLLLKHPLGERARQYLQERGVSEKLWETFGLGFAPSSWENLTAYLRKKDFTEKELEESGLVIEGKRGFYDRFRDRIMFPIRTSIGQIIAFSGRTLQKDAQEAKYINSPETMLYTKGDTLYGIDVTKDAIRKQGSVIVAEGEFDVISSFQAGVSHIVAIKGTALTEAQIQLIKRFTDRIQLALDHDSAGDAAMRRGIALAEKANLDITVITIAGGKDPDEAAREDAVLWKKAVSEAVPIYNFLIDSAFTRFNSHDAYGKKKISEELVAMLSSIENPIIQAHYTKHVSQRLGVSESSVEAALKKIRSTPKKISANSPVSTEKTVVTSFSKEEQRERYLLSLIIQNEHPGELLEQVVAEIDPSDLRSPVVSRIFMELIDYQSQGNTLVMAEFAKMLPSELISAFDELYLQSSDEEMTQTDFKKELLQTIKRVKREVIDHQLSVINKQLINAGNPPDPEQLEKLQREAQRLASVRRDLT